MDKFEIKIISKHHKDRMQVCFIGTFLLGFTLRGKPIKRKLSATRHLVRKGEFWTGAPLPGSNATIWMSDSDFKPKSVSQPEVKAA